MFIFYIYIKGILSRRGLCVYTVCCTEKKQKNSHTQQNTNTEIEALHCGSRGGPGFNLGRESRISWGGEVSTGGAPAIWGVAVFKKNNKTVLTFRIYIFLLLWPTRRLINSKGRCLRSLQSSLEMTATV